MKYVKGLSVAVLGLGLMVPVAQADLFGALNKAADTVNKVNTTTQEASTKAQSAQDAAAGLKSAAAQQLLTSALASQLSAGSTTKADLISLLGEPVKAKLKGKTETLTYKAESVATHLETAQAIATAVGVQTPDISGTVDVVLKDNVLQSYNIANLLVK